jgi:hypothetical protein
VLGGLRHRIEGEDLCDGSGPATALVHEVHAEGIDALGGSVISGTSSCSVPVEAEGALSVEIEGFVDPPVSPGDELEVTVLVCNAGDVTIEDLRLQVDDIWPAYSFADLEPGGCVASFDMHCVTPDELSTRVAVIHAHAWGDHPCGCTIESSMSVEVDLE